MLTNAGPCLVALLTLASCGGSSKPAPMAPPPPPPAKGEKAAGGESCQQAVDVLFAVTAASEAPAIKARSSKVFVGRCEADRWSAEIRGCMVGVKAPEDADRCEALLTPEQRTELRDELARELDAAGVKPEVKCGRPGNTKPAAKEAAPSPEPEPAADKKKAVPPKKPAASPKSSKGRADPCEGGE